MPPRADEPPRRGSEPRRGAARRAQADRSATDRSAPPDRDLADRAAAEASTGFGGISDALAYTPRGRTVRENADRARGADPFRPALRVLDGGEAGPARDRRRGGADAAAAQRARRGAPPAADDDFDEPGPARRGGPTSRTTASRVAASRTATDDDPRGLGPARRGAAADRDAGRTAAGRDAGRTAAGERAEPRIGPARAESGRGRARTDAEHAGRGRGARTDSEDGDTRADRTARRGTGRSPAQPGPDRTVETRRRTADRGAAEGRTTDRRGDDRRRPGADRRGTGKRPAPPPPAAPPKLAEPGKRLRIGTVLVLALFTLIAGRLVVLQLVNTPAYAARLAELRDARLARVDLPAPRGSILDRDGNHLARSVEARLVFVDPGYVENPEKVAAALSPLLAVSQSDLLPLIRPHKRPGGGDSRFEYLARGISVSQAEAIERLDLKGIGTDRDERRVIPNSDLAANLIGFTGSDLNGLNGLEGLEAKYDSLLRGRPGKLIYEQGNPDAAKGQFAKKEIPGGFRQETPAHPGSSLRLTIDSDLQHQVQAVLAEHMKRQNAGTGGAVVLDVRTGEVLAQASYPPYDPTRPNDFKPTDRVDAVSNFVVDPGSTHKALIFGAALEEGLVKPGDSIVVGPGIEKGGQTFRDSHQHPKGARVSLPELLAYSSNVGTIRLGDMLGPERIVEYQKRFGLGSPTGEGVAGEASGRVLPPSQWSGSAYGSVPIGHSVDATLIQMAAAYAAIANDGVYVQPHLIQETIAADGTRTPAPAPVTRRVLRPETAIELRRMLEAVVQVKGGTGRLAKLDDYRVAGKTGTGTRVINGKYSTNNTSSFIGMAPAENPRYVVAVFGDVPQGTGGVVAGPAFKEMMEFTLAHYRVPPPGTKPPTFGFER